MLFWQSSASCQVFIQVGPRVFLLLCSYADSYSPVKLSALTSGKVSIDQLEEGDLDYATSMDAMAKLRGRMKLAIAHFIGAIIT